MRSTRLGALTLLLLPLANLALAAEHVGDIEFFGYRGLDIAKIRAVLPVHEGDPFTDKLEEPIRQAILKSIGKQPTQVGFFCCDEKGGELVFIGLPGENYKQFSYNPAPTGKERLAPDIRKLANQLEDATDAAVQKGGDAPREDDSNGYALIQYPPARALQLLLREWAIHHNAEILRVLDSSTTDDRRIAGEALGYADQSPEQVKALVHASHDSDETVRNNATRALSVLARSNKELAAQIPPEPFIEMVNSGIWVDRNKAVSLLWELSASRDPKLLAKLRATALDSLIEMATWRRTGHAYAARAILARIAGVPEEQVGLLANSRPTDEILRAARQR